MGGGTIQWRASAVNAQKGNDTKDMRALLVAGVAAILACGGHSPIPTRGVVEGGLGAWKFRRFQGPLLDVEVWVEGNKAEAYSASYITADAEKRGRIEDKDLVNVFVTRYQTADGVVRATVKLPRRLAADNGYQVEEGKIAGARTLSITGRGEAWVMWPSSRYVVKGGGRGRADRPGSGGGRAPAWWGWRPCRVPPPAGAAGGAGGGPPPAARPPPPAAPQAGRAGLR